MNELKLKINNIKLALSKVKKVCININEYTDILGSTVIEHHDFEMITKKEILKIGIYAKFNDGDIYVHYTVTPGFIRFSNCEELSVKDIKWSEEFKLIELNEKLFNLKAFW